jgi:hypothetical protein
MTDVITIRGKGTIPLLYNAITGARIPRGRLQLRMREVYPYIVHIGHEYAEAYNKLPKLAYINMDIESGEKGLRLTAGVGKIAPGSVMPRKSELKVLANFARDAANPNRYVTSWVAGEQDAARAKLLSKVRRYLLYCFPESQDNIRALTPISNRQLMLPEELPIILAFFHLSNVVRYDPEFLARLKDSGAWAMLLTLRRTAPRTFLELFWANTMKRHLVVQ